MSVKEMLLSVMAKLQPETYLKRRPSKGALGETGSNKHAMSKEPTKYKDRGVLVVLFSSTRWVQSTLSSFLHCPLNTKQCSTVDESLLHREIQFP